MKTEGTLEALSKTMGTPIPTVVTISPRVATVAAPLSSERRRRRRRRAAGAVSQEWLSLARPQPQPQPRRAAGAIRSGFTLVPLLRIMHKGWKFKLWNVSHYSKSPGIIFTYFSQFFECY